MSAYMNKKLAEMVTDFIGLQSTPANIGSAAKAYVEERQIDVAAIGIAVASASQGTAAVLAHVMRNPALLNTAIPGQRGQCRNIS